MDITEYTSPDYIKFIESEDKFSVIEELALLFEGSQTCADIPTLTHALKDRERIMSTGIGFGIAIPHAKIEQVKKLTFAVGISKEGIDFNSMDGKPVHLVILVAAGEDQHKYYLSLMSNIMSLLKDESKKEEIINSASEADVMRLLSHS